MFLALLAPLVYMSCTVHDMYTNGASQVCVCVCVCVCVRACGLGFECLKRINYILTES